MVNSPDQPIKCIRITVVNFKDHPPAGTINCGRPTALGNPFVMRKESERDDVCDRYERYYYERKAQRHPEMGDMFWQLMDHAMQTGVLNIGCFCAPRRCHLDTVRADLIHELTLLGFTVS